MMAEADPRRLLRRCVGDPDAFAADVFGRRPLLRRRTGGDDYRDLLSLDAVDDILATRSLRAPAFRLVRDGAPLPRSAYTRVGTVGGRRVGDLPDVGRVHDLFADGATIVLQGLHRWWQPVTRLCRGLERALTHPVQANAYLTPPGSAGLDLHRDGHDVLVLQSGGSKHWVVHDRDGPAGRDDGGPGGEPALDVTLEPGDSLYLPRGTPHAAETTRRASVHLTVGIRALTWHDVARRAVDSLAGAADGTTPSLDDPLPAGFADDPGLAGQVAAHLRSLADRIGDVDPARLADEVVGGLVSGRRPVLDGQLAQLLALDDIDDDTPVSRRRDCFARVVGAGPDTGDGDARRTVELVLGDRRVRLPARAGAAVRRLLEAERLPVRALDDLLDRRGRRVLVRRLVREGLLRAHHDDGAHV